MPKKETKSRFEARLMAPAEPDDDRLQAFVILPKDASARLPRRGRTTVAGTINGQAFQTTLEPDGQRSHWLALSQPLLKAAKAQVGDTASFEIESVAQEPEPEVPADLLDALEAHPDARETWDATTTIARVDWIHWIVTAKQQKTRVKRINEACDMLSSGKRRVCCFDPSGFYSKALSAPEVAKTSS